MFLLNAVLQYTHGSQENSPFQNPKNLSSTTPHIPASFSLFIRRPG
ncbi:hypothetical protein ARMA_0196 [Ardenticatena maritima]|uniref:Uncharacterized protein n=1 Tax=Ardenticatena maritima TaxID=872965 RepID=A0A0M8K4Z6_9CHLR|nr:hypothetical protein ARMA_0196 [Ardenticatena maritima]